MTTSAKTDPKKIAERLEQTKSARQECRVKSRDEAVRQIQDHARSAQQSSEKALDKSRR